MGLRKYPSEKCLQLFSLAIARQCVKITGVYSVADLSGSGVMCYRWSVSCPVCD